MSVTAGLVMELFFHSHFAGFYPPTTWTRSAANWERNSCEIEKFLSEEQLAYGTLAGGTQTRSEGAKAIRRTLEKASTNADQDAVTKFNHHPQFQCTERLPSPCANFFLRHSSTRRRAAVHVRRWLNGQQDELWIERSLVRSRTRTSRPGLAKRTMLTSYSTAE